MNRAPTLITLIGIAIVGLFPCGTANASGFRINTEFENQSKANIELSYDYFANEGNPIPVERPLISPYVIRLPKGVDLAWYEPEGDQDCLLHGWDSIYPDQERTPENIRKNCAKAVAGTAEVEFALNGRPGQTLTLEGTLLHGAGYRGNPGYRLHLYSDQDPIIRQDPFSECRFLCPSEEDIAKENSGGVNEVWQVLNENGELTINQSNYGAVYGWRSALSKISLDFEPKLVSASCSTGSWQTSLEASLGQYDSFGQVLPLATIYAHESPKKCGTAQLPYLESPEVRLPQKLVKVKAGKTSALHVRYRNRNEANQDLKICVLSNRNFSTKKNCHFFTAFPKQTGTVSLLVKGKKSKKTRAVKARILVSYDTGTNGLRNIHRVQRVIVQKSIRTKYNTRG